MPEIRHRPARAERERRLGHGQRRARPETAEIAGSKTAATAAKMTRVRPAPPSVGIVLRESRCGLEVRHAEAKASAWISTKPLVERGERPAVLGAGSRKRNRKPLERESACRGTVVGTAQLGYRRGARHEPHLGWRLWLGSGAQGIGRMGGLVTLAIGHRAQNRRPSGDSAGALRHVRNNNVDRPGSTCGTRMEE